MVANNIDFNAPTRSIKAKLEIHDDLAEEPIYTVTSQDALVNFKIDRIGEKGKFFGFGIVQKLTFELLDKEREIFLNKDNLITVYMDAGEGYQTPPLPVFLIDEVKRNENTNGLTVTAYDTIGRYGTTKTVNDILRYNPTSIEDYATYAAEEIGIPSFPEDEYTDSILEREYPNGANYDGKETVREVLDDVAEATQTIYYMKGIDELIFKRLSIDDEPVLSIDSNAYFTLELQDGKTLTRIVSVTELGDNVGYGSTNGATQYVRENAFWVNQDDIGNLVENAVVELNSLYINQYNIKWRGNYFLELGDRIAVVRKDYISKNTFFLNDTMVYNGGLTQTSSWSYEAEDETASNPSSLGAALNETFARVDKSAKKIELVASETTTNSTNISSLNLTTNNISANVAELGAAVDAAMTSEDVRLEIQRQLLEGGVDKVTTATGFTFNEAGLTISKSGTEMETLVSEDGMVVNKNGAEMLKANNVGVVAKNLHAITYLIIGENSRFENYGSSRTGCFWIGG